MAKKLSPPTLMRGYPNNHAQQYMNVGYAPLSGGRKIYPGKVGHGDYGPSQGGLLYYDVYGNRNHWNGKYVYPLDYSPEYNAVVNLKKVGPTYYY